MVITSAMQHCNRSFGFSVTVPVVSLLLFISALAHPAIYCCTAQIRLLLVLLLWANRCKLLASVSPGRLDAALWVCVRPLLLYFFFLLLKVASLFACLRYFQRSPLYTNNCMKRQLGSLAPEFPGLCPFVHSAWHRDSLQLLCPLSHLSAAVTSWSQLIRLSWERHLSLAGLVPQPVCLKD